MSPSNALLGPTVISSPLDNREYRTFTLPNTLSVLLVSDKESDKAAASMDVGVGYFSDPDELPGLAHFLEHMLFLGTEKYPDEASYNQYLSEHGGFSNAFTSMENTNYQFEVVVSHNSSNTKASQDMNGHGSTSDTKVDLETCSADELISGGLYEALDRFAQFFIAPLFEESATERELNAVDSEHQKNILTDNWRLLQLQKSSANPKHPFYKFGTGSKETLWDQARKAGIDTRAKLLEFHDKFYSANLMTLCLMGPYSLDVMQNWVVEMFSKIPNKNVQHPSVVFSSIEPFTDEHMRRVISTVPVKDSRTLELFWIVPPPRRSFRSKPTSYVSHLLGHEGTGSLLSCLKQRGWADGLMTGATDYNEDFAIFEVSIELTQEGVDHIDDITSLVFGYIHLIQKQGIERWIHDEAAAISEMAFRFSERSEPFNAAMRLSMQMHMYPPEEYVRGAYVLDEYDPDGIRALLDLMTPNRVNMHVVGKFVENTTDKEETWYRTPYRIDTIPESKLESWRTVEPIEELAIPKQNPFIPTDFELVQTPLPIGEDDLTGPEKIVSEEHGELHFKCDRTFRRPKATVRAKLLSSVAYNNPKNAMLTNMFTMLLEDAMNEYAFDASIAGLEYALHYRPYGIYFSVDGYNHKLQTLLDALLDHMSSFEVRADRFPIIRDQLERMLANFDKEQPYQHAMYESSYLLETPRWHVRDSLATLRDGEITIEAMQEFIPVLLSHMYLVMFVHGNVNSDWATAAYTSTRDKLGFSALPPAERVERRVVQLPTEYETTLRRNGSNEEDHNSAVEVAFQIGANLDLKTEMTLELLAEMMNKPCFHELRTKQQLGYMVFEGSHRRENARSLFVIVQSTVADPADLSRRIDKFIEDFRTNTLPDMNDSEFDSYRQSMITLKKQKDTRLGRRSNRMWKEISSQEFMYDRAQREIEALEALAKADIVEFCARYIAPDGDSRRRLTSMVYGSEHPIPKDEENGETAANMVGHLVTDAIAFRNRMLLYPASGAHDAFA